MYFNKISHPANFSFNESAAASGVDVKIDGARFTFSIRSLGSDVHRISVANSRWTGHGSEAELADAIPGEADRCLVGVTRRGDLQVSEVGTQRVLLRGLTQATFGVCGRSWMFQFKHDAAMEFYGLGEHSRGFEKSGQRAKFWNTDLYGDFPLHENEWGHPNPMYISMPYLIVKQGNHYIGLLVNNPGAVFMDLASNFIWDPKNLSDQERGSFYLGALDGTPELYVIIGPSLAELTCKLQTLVGRTPLPPVWALGYHQCRWGYAGPADLKRLDEKFREHGIPCDGLWLDIDYMDRYRVFTFTPKLWGNAKSVRKVLRDLTEKGRRIVPILDPGVAVQPGYTIYESGLKQEVFCLNRNGKPFVGFVWPGKTHFPDFSLGEAREWWAEHVKAFAGTGVSGAWLDMNDPSIGSVELDDMQFGRGKKPHESYHNQYALGMARASRAGFLSANPDHRPFLLTRSAFLSSSRYAAAWTGDNFSNWHHLRLVIPVSLGLALSGQPFNGPDVGGFVGDTTPELAIAWYKTCFLFPFIRNHSMLASRAQEPWALGAEAQRTISHFIRLRYKLLPYLYQLFIEQARTGAALLRPLFHDFEDTAATPLGKIADQFLMGPALLQAPVLNEKAVRRIVTLPGTDRWFSAMNGTWIKGGRKISVTAGKSETPLFVREGSVVPMQAGDRSDNRNNFGQIEVHCFMRRDRRGIQEWHYTFDDGESYAFEKGARTRCTLEFEVIKRHELQVTVRELDAKYRPLSLQFVVYDSFSQVVVVRRGRRSPLALRPRRWRFTGEKLSALATAWIDVTTG